MKPGGKKDQSRRDDTADRTASLFLRATGRNDDRAPPAVFRKPKTMQRIERKPRRS